MSSTDKYNGDTKKNQHFLHQVNNKADSFGWNDILKVVVGSDTKNLIDNYGEYYWYPTDIITVIHHLYSDAPYLFLYPTSR